jgi:hypothetical protein
MSVEDEVAALRERVNRLERVVEALNVARLPVVRWARAIGGLLAAVVVLGGLFFLLQSQIVRLGVTMIELADRVGNLKQQVKDLRERPR